MKLSTFLEYSVHSFEVDHLKKLKALEMTYYDCMATCARLLIHEAMNSIGKETKK